METFVHECPPDLMNEVMWDHHRIRQLNDELAEWLDENVNRAWWRRNTELVFENQADWLLFKLVWLDSREAMN